MQELHCGDKNQQRGGRQIQRRARKSISNNILGAREVNDVIGLTELNSAYVRGL